VDLYLEMLTTSMLPPHSPQSQRVVGLTGGIATGKSTVSDYLSHTYDIPILDADLLARDAVAPGSKILTAVFDHFGNQIRHHDGSLNRAALGNIIFANPAERAWLEAQIHPYVRQQLVKQSAVFPEKLPIVMVIPLLFEAKMTDLVNEIWVVTCEPEQQLLRLQKRNQLSLAQAQARIASQMPLTEKIALADVVLVNTGDLENLYQQIQAAWQKLSN
jgi:dephospho-CoA kinase